MSTERNRSLDADGCLAFATASAAASLRLTLTAAALRLALAAAAVRLALTAGRGPECFLRCAL